MYQKRRKIWIDRFQTYLFLRLAFYFAFYQVAVWSLVTIERSTHVALASILGQDAATFGLLVAIGIVGVVSLLFICDVAVFSHRIVGPLYRFRKTIQAVTAGEVELVRLRKGDFLQELKDDFNEMLKALEQRGGVTLKTHEAKQDQNQPVPV